MAIHDWTKVDAGIFHDFRHGWTCAIARALNEGLMSPDYYALLERPAASLGQQTLQLSAPLPTDASGDASVPEVERYAEKLTCRWRLALIQFPARFPVP